MAKTHRRKIRIGGKNVHSPRFKLKADADRWYEEMKRRKQFARDGVSYLNNTRQTVLAFAQTFMHRRMKDYPLATWQPDEQRLRDYILPKIGELPISTITASQIKSLLLDMTDSGLSIGTRNKVKTLLSTMFSAALNMDPPLVNYNPVSGIKFSERRIGKAQPSFIADPDDCLKFLKAARDLGPEFQLIAATVLMSGLRKSEMIALTWSRVDFKYSKIIVDQKVEQASLTVKRGTKRGEEIGREVPVPKELLTVLLNFRSISRFNQDKDFIFTTRKGRFINPRTISARIEQVRKASGIDVTVHGLRHTYGREFVQRGGSLKQLQAILGHSNSATTDLYSDLSGKRLDKSGEIVKWNLEE